MGEYSGSNNASLRSREHDFQKLIAKQVARGDERAAIETERRLREVRQELNKRSFR